MHQANKKTDFTVDPNMVGLARLAPIIKGIVNIVFLEWWVEHVMDRSRLSGSRFGEHTNSLPHIIPASRTFGTITYMHYIMLLTTKFGPLHPPPLITATRQVGSSFSIVIHVFTLFTARAAAAASHLGRSGVDVSPTCSAGTSLSKLSSF